MKDMRPMEDESITVRTVLSEYESKRLLAHYDIPITREVLVEDRHRLMEAVEAIGYPVVLKGCSPNIAHKTETGLVHLDLKNEDQVLAAYDEITKNIIETENTDATVLVQEMVSGKRELVAGLTRDPQFGPCVMFGLGGIFTEVLNDVVFRVAPLEKSDALEMTREIKGHRILDAIRGMAAVDMDRLGDILMAIGRIGMENEKIIEIDINPLIISAGKPVAVDALMVLESPGD